MPWHDIVYNDNIVSIVCFFKCHHSNVKSTHSFEIELEQVFLIKRIRRQMCFYAQFSLKAIKQKSWMGNIELNCMDLKA